MKVTVKQRLKKQCQDLNIQHCNSDTAKQLEQKIRDFFEKPIQEEIQIDLKEAMKSISISVGEKEFLKSKYSSQLYEKNIWLKIFEKERLM